jgi:hypothetical protein
MTAIENAERRGDGWVPEGDRDLDAPRPFLGPLVRTLRPYRRIVSGVIGLAALLVVVVGLGLWIYYPLRKEATLDFRPDFDGVQDGKYPNGSKFSAEDLLSEPVLRHVYDENALKKYATFEKFRGAVFVTSSNKALELLEMEYKVRLADTKLQPVDRQRIEREFREKAASLKNSTFHLTLIRSDRLREMDSSLMEKVLRGILSAWADDVVKIRGAMKYDLPIYSPAMLQKEFLETEDYLISADLLRRKVIHLVSSIDLLMKVPGIQVFRIPGSGASLPEIRLRLEDIGTFRITPALSLIRATGLSNNPAATMRYIEDRLFETSRAEKLAQDQEGKVRGGMESYVRTEKSMASRPVGSEGTPGGGRELSAGMVIPQLGESFLDRLMDLADTKGDKGYRKDLTERMISSGLGQAELASEASYYRELETAFKNVRKPIVADASRAATLKEIQTRFAAILAEMEKSISEIQQLYELISVRNLRPASFLYTVERPVIFDSTSAFPFLRYLALGVLFVGFAGCAAAAGALIHARLRAGRT